MAKRTEQGFRELDFDGYKPAGRDYQPPENVDEMTQTIEMGLSAIRKTGGRAAKYPEDEKGLKEFYDRGLEYFEEINKLNATKSKDQRPVVPDFEAFSIWLGISRVTLFMYEKRGGKWAELIGIFKTLIVSARKQLVTSYKVPPLWEIFNLVNNGVQYQNTSQITINSGEIEQKRKDAEIETQLDSAGLIWDEQSQEYIPESEAKQ